MPTVSFTETLDLELRDPDAASEFLNAVLEDGSPKEIANAIAAVLRANGEKSAHEVQDGIVLLRRFGIVLNGIRRAA